MVLLGVVFAMPPGVARAATGYTGLIVLVRGVHIDRSMSPAILTPSGQIVYGRGWWKPGQLSVEVADGKGIVEYAPSIQEARRAGSQPLVVEAIGVTGPALSNFNTDVIVSEQDAAEIRTANARARFLERLQVDFVALPAQVTPTRPPYGAPYQIP